MTKGVGSNVTLVCPTCKTVFCRAKLANKAPCPSCATAHPIEANEKILVCPTHGRMIKKYIKPKTHCPVHECTQCTQVCCDECQDLIAYSNFAKHKRVVHKHKQNANCAPFVQVENEQEALLPSMQQYASFFANQLQQESASDVAFTGVHDDLLSKKKNNLLEEEDE